ncbi:cell cycle checkpoint control protein RAD9A-like [Cylas formicarius]|uniref:cell cycle checkpoint control protein RAD9A-like n=1 Tax=Cylas formicarius TaxID=197179 RepID=UPI0029585816|nr:cell cycle checkpoint control protein RAD9A-like [Cylas formicarius]
MNTIIPAMNAKILGRQIQALARIGDELFIEARPEKLTFITYNQCKTICGQFDLLESFFSQYDINLENPKDQDTSVLCKIHMKTLLPVFKGTNYEKKLDYMKMEYVNNSDLMVFKMKYKCDDIVLVHKLTLMEPEIFQLKKKTDSSNNSVCAPSSFYNQLLAMFSSSDDDITLEVNKNKVIVRNYCLGAPVKPKSVRSQINLNGSEFSLFKIQTETTVNFSLKPFRSAVQFADAFNLNLGINFDRGGRPLTIFITNPTFQMEFVVSTLDPTTEAQSTMTTSSLATKITQVSTNGLHNITCEDLEAIANEDWEEFNMELESNKKTNPNSCKSSEFSDLLKEVSKKVDNFSDSNLSENKKMKTNKKINILNSAVINSVNLDIVPRSPESPRTKRARLLFKRSYDPTFHPNMFDDVLVGNSDSE